MTPLFSPSLKLRVESHIPSASAKPKIVSFQFDPAPVVRTNGGRTNHGLTGAGGGVSRVGRSIGGLGSWVRFSADVLGGVGDCDGCCTGSGGGPSSDSARTADTQRRPAPAIRTANDVRNMIALLSGKLPRNSFHRSSSY